MISVLLVLGASALVGAAAGRWVTSRRAVQRAEPDAPAPPPDERGPIGLGDVVVLDEGRGQELWVARSLSLREGELPPWLTLFEADGPERSRAVLAWDPADASSFALLRPAPIGGLSLIPSTLEVEGAPMTLQARRTSHAALACAPASEASEGASELAPEGEVLVALYRGGARGFAVVARSHDRTRLYAGESVALHEVSILKA